MNQKKLLPLACFYSPLINSYFLFFSVLTRISLCSVNPKFEACVPGSCGDGQSISFPFYIQGVQKPFCGYPGFDLYCGNDGHTILNLSNTQYILHEIFYNNQSLRVSNAAFSISSIDDCLAPVDKNFTLIGSKFHLASNQSDLLLVFGCDLQSPSEGLQDYIVGCSKENKTASVLGLRRNDKKLNFALKNCTGEVVTTKVEDENGNIGEALRRGFVLNWTASECSECARSGGKCGFDYAAYAFRCHCPDGDHARKCEASEDRRLDKSLALKIGLGVVLALTVVLVLVIAMRYFTVCKKQNPTHLLIEAFLERHGPLQARRYSYSDVKKVTNSFRNKLGQGGYGSVYKGKLLDGRLVAVKVLSELKGNGEEFINEVASISKTSHVNIVTLLGFCCEGSRRALVYEFMHNGSLEKFIYVRASPQLDYQTLYNIAIGVGRGLEYLHRGCNARILHFDIKPHNILLDEDFCPKISDFGLAKICPRKESNVSILGARGTAGYIAPELFSRNFGGVSHKSDVYSYGMMVLEMVGGRKNINTEVDRSSELYFPHWIYNHLESNQELRLPCIRDESDNEKVRKMSIVSLWCIQTNSSTRPTMSKVLEMLEGSLELLQMPPKPFLSSPSASPDDRATQTLETL